jgi:hypothetical protein
LGLAEYKRHGRSAVLIPYLDENGAAVLSRWRVGLKEGQRFDQPKGVRLQPYGRHTLHAAERTGQVWIVGEESDVQTLGFAGEAALGLPGALTFKPEWVSFLDPYRHADILIVVEGDAAGQAGARRSGQALAKHLPGANIHLVKPAGFKDVGDAWRADHDKERFIAWLSACPRQRLEDVLATDRSREAENLLATTNGLSDRPDILQAMADVMRRSGLAGDRRLSKLLYLAITSRLLPRPVNLFITGPSSVGKSTEVDAVLKLFPADAFYRLTACSERALIYSEEDLAHRVVVVAEAASFAQDGAGAVVIRSLAWEGKLNYDTVENSPDGLVARHIEKAGPTGLITTTVGELEPELATRMLEASVPDTPEHTQAVLHAIADVAEGVLADMDFSPFIAAQGWLQIAGRRRVLVPFAHAMAELFPAGQVRARRDFSQLVTLIQAHALLYQRQRELDGAGRVLATLADYQAVHDIVADIFAATAADSCSPAVRETVEAVRSLQEATDAVPDAADPNCPSGPSISEAAAKLGIDRSAASRRVAKAIHLGFLVNLQPRRGRPAVLVLGDPLPDAQALPTPEDLAAVHSKNERTRARVGQEATPDAAPNPCTDLCIPSDDRAQVHTETAANRAPVHSVEPPVHTSMHGSELSGGKGSEATRAVVHSNPEEGDRKFLAEDELREGSV